MDEDLPWRLAQATKQISKPFSCGGSFPPHNPLTICYRQAHAHPSPWSSLSFPAENMELLDHLASACSHATFGLNGNAVLDSSYRNSLKLDCSDFTTCFDLAEYGILDLVKRLLFPKLPDMVITKLYKLNVYKTGHFFKPHVDTPRDDKQVASLVVSLPSSYKGGDLLVRHGSKTQSFCWGGEENKLQICWAAFYSDCEHEVAEVSEGYRITLTYNMYVVVPEKREVAKGVDFTANDLYKLFCEAAQKNVEERTLGFPCKHFYPLSEERRNVIPQVLKGADAYIYAAALAAGLKVRVCRVWEPSDGDGERARYIDENHGGTFKLSSSCHYLEDNFDMARCFDLEEDEGQIEWCIDTFDWHLGGACATYGNEPSVEAIYCAAAILVTLPSSDSD